MLGQRLAAGRAGQHPGQVERPDPRQGSIACGHRLGGRLADLDDLEQRQGGHGGGLRRRQPLRFVADQGAAAAGIEDRLLEGFAVPQGHRCGNRCPVGADAEHREIAVAQIEEIAMQVDPALVLQLVETGDFIARPGWLAPVDLQVMVAAQGCGRRDQVDLQGLLTSGFQGPEIGCGEAGSGDRSRPRCGQPVGAAEQGISTRKLD